MELTPAPTFTIRHPKLGDEVLTIDPMELSAEVQLALSEYTRDAEGRYDNAEYVRAVSAAVSAVIGDSHTSKLSDAQRFTIGERVLREFEKLGKG